MVLRRGRYLGVARQISQELAHLCLPQIPRMAELMEPDEPLHPIPADLFRPETVMLQAHHIAHLLEQFFPLPGHPAPSTTESMNSAFTRSISRRRSGLGRIHTSLSDNTGTTN